MNYLFTHIAYINEIKICFHFYFQTVYNIKPLKHLKLDISTNAKTKEEYLSKGCQARIRGYLSKARTQLFATKFDVLLDNRKNDEKHVSSGLINGLNNSCRRPRRKIIPTGNQRRNKYSEKQAKYEEVETSDEEAWDEIDATLLQNYRGNIIFKNIQIRALICNF